MDEPHPPPNPNPNPTVCEECRSNPWKYRCPGCSLRSCSLPCVNSHKRRTACTGKRKLNEVVPIDQFDDNLLISDYNMLEEVKRLAESSRRMRVAICGVSKRRPPPGLWQAVYHRKFRLFYLPTGMARVQKNKTRHCPKTNSIFWTVEWRFHSTDVILIDHDVDEHVSLSTVIKKHLKPGPWNNKLKPFCDVQLDDLRFFLKKNQRSPKSPYRQLNINGPVRQQLVGTVVLEYPIIHIFLPSDSYNFKVDPWKFRIENWKQPSSNILDISSSPPGPAPREEEIEDEESSPQLLDISEFNMEKAGSSNGQMSKAAGEVSKSSCDDGSNACVAGEGGDIVHVTDGCSKSSDKFFEEDQSVDFEKELREFYSDFIGEMNPDEFLSLNEGLNDYGLEETEKSLYFAERFLLDEELEEGEIPS